MTMSASSQLTMRQKLENALTYQTPRIVKIVDRKIGLTYYAICTVIFSYIFFYVLLYRQMAYERESTVGGSILQPSFPSQRYIVLTNKQERRVFDVGDIVRSIGETSGLFIASKVSVTQNQTIKQCNTVLCSRDSECPVSEPPFREHKCLAEGFCKEISWCPRNMDNASTKTYVI